MRLIDVHTKLNWKQLDKQDMELMDKQDMELMDDGLSQHCKESK